MNGSRLTGGRSSLSARWVARLLGIVSTSVFLLLVGLAVTNEDKPHAAAIPVLTLLVLTIVATLAAWRWERVGGLVVALLALCLSAAAYSASLAIGLSSLSFIPAFIYGAPFLIVGSLFYMCGRRAASGPRHDIAPPPPLLRRWWFIGAVLATIVALTLIIAVLMTSARVGDWLDVALNTSACLGVLAQHDSPVQSVAFSPDGAWLASASKDGTVRVWRADDDQRFGQSPLHARKTSTGGKEAGYSHDLTFSPNGTLMAIGLPDGRVQLWQVSGGALFHTLEGQSGKVCSLAFSPEGRVLAAGTWDGPVNLWRISDGTLLRTMEGHTRGVVSLAFSPDGTTLASASLDRTTTLWNVSSGTAINQLESQSATTGVAFSPDGSVLVTAGAADQDLQLWSTEDWSPIRKLESARGGMGTVAFSPGGTMLAAGNARYEVVWWRVADGALLRAVKGHRDSVNSVAFSPDGQMLASGSLDGTVKLWQVPSAGALP